MSEGLHRAAGISMGERPHNTWYAEIPAAHSDKPYSHAIVMLNRELEAIASERGCKVKEIEFSPLILIDDTLRDGVPVKTFSCKVYDQ